MERRQLIALRCAWILLSAALLSAVSVPARRYSANLDRKTADRILSKAQASGQAHQRRQLALRAIELSDRCIAIDSADYRILAIRAAAESTLGSNERAIETYQAALALNERPEFYAYMGVLQLELGSVDEAVANLSRAAMFSESTAQLVAWPLRRTVENAARKRREALQQGSELRSPIVR